MWKIIYSIPSKEQGVIVLLQSIVNKKAEKAGSPLTVHNLNRVTGLDILIEKLDNTFKNEIVEDTCSIYLKFTNLKKQPSMSMNLVFDNLSHGMS